MRVLKVSNDAHRLVTLVAATSATDLWVYGTADGVALDALRHWDGSAWTVPPLDDATAMVVTGGWRNAAPGAPGHVWVGTNTGTSLLDLTADGHAIEHGPEVGAVFGANFLMASGMDTTYVATNFATPALYALNAAGLFTRVPQDPPGFVVGLRVTPDGKLWAAYDDAKNANAQSLARFDGQAWTLITVPNGVTADLNFAYASTNDVWKTVVRATDATAWQVARFDGTAFTTVSVAAPAGWGSTGLRHNGLDYMAQLGNGKVGLLSVKQNVVASGDTIHLDMIANEIVGAGLGSDIAIFHVSDCVAAGCPNPPTFGAYYGDSGLILSGGRDVFVGGLHD